MSRLGALLLSLVLLSGFSLLQAGVNDVSGYSISKQINYDQSSATQVALDPKEPYVFQSNIQGGSTGALLSSSSLITPTNGTFSYDAGANQLVLQQDFLTKAAFDTAFPDSGNYNLSIQTTTPSNYSTQLVFDPENYPPIPQLLSVTNAQWINGYLVVTDPTQPITFTWNPAGVATTSMINISGSTGGVANSGQFVGQQYVLAGGSLANDAYYQANILFSNPGGTHPTINSAFGNANFQTQVSFTIQVGTPVLTAQNNYVIQKNHVLVQTSNRAPADGSGDNDAFDPAPYSLKIQSPVAETVNGPGGSSYALGYQASGGKSNSSNYYYTSGPLSLGSLNAASHDGSYRLINSASTNGDVLNLNGQLFPNAPQVTLVNGATPVWNAQGQLVLDPTVINTITWSAFNITGTLFASAGHEEAGFYSYAGDNVNVKQKAGISESSLVPFTSLIIPANTLTVNHTYIGNINYSHASSFNYLGGGTYEIANYQTETFFTAVAAIPVTTLYQVIKENVLVQNSASPPVNASGNVVDPAPYNFYAKSPVAGSITGPSSAGPYLLTLGTGSQNYAYRSSASNTQASLDATYADGTYTLTDGNQVNLTGDVYPNAPQVLLVNGTVPTWSAQGVLELNPNIDNVITWTSFTASNPSFTFATGGHESIEVRGNQDSVLLKQKAFGPSGDTAFSTFTIPAGTLTPGNTYNTTIGYSLASALGNPSALVYDFAGYETETYFVVAAASAGTTPQNITFPSPGNQQVLGSNVTLGASSDSSLAVSYVVVSGPGSISGNLLFFTGSGTVVVAAVQAGDSTYLSALPVEQTFTVSPSNDVSNDNIQKSISYDQAGPGIPTLDPQDPYQFSSSINPNGNGVAILSSSTLTPPANSTTLVSYQANSNGVYLQDAFPSKAALDAAFPNGTYNFFIQTSTPSNVSDQITLSGDNYPVVPQITGITNATWNASAGCLVVTDPTQPVIFTWNNPNGAEVNFGISLDTSAGTSLTVAGTQYAAGSNQTTYTLNGNTLQNNSLYKASLQFFNGTGNVNFQTQVQFEIQTGTPIQPATSINYIGKSHNLVQSSNNVPVDGTGDLQNFDAAPYNVSVNCLAAGSVPGPNNINLPLGYHAGDRSNSGRYRYSSGPITSQAALDAAYPDGNYTLTDGTVVSLTGSVYPNVPQVTQVNGKTPVWNSQGQLELDPTVINTITFSPIDVTNSVFAAVGHETTQFSSTGQDNVDIRTKYGISQTSLTPTNTIIIPANTMTVGDIYVGDVGYALCSSVTTPSTGVYDVAAYSTDNYFYAVAIPHTGQPQTISFPAINSIQFVGSTLTLNATASSGLPVTYTYSGEGATITGNVISFTATGGGTIQANQAGNGTYGSATSATQAITITQPTDVSFASLEKSINYVQTTPTTLTLQAEGPYQFSANVQTGSTGELLSSSAVTAPSGSTGTVAFQASTSNGLNFDQSFVSKATLDATFKSGASAAPYNFTIQTSSPSTYKNIQLPFLADNYPTVLPQLISVSNANWSNGHLVIIDPTQNTTFTWSSFSSANGNINFNIDNLNIGQNFQANGTNISFVVPGGTFSSNTAYVGELDFTNSSGSTTSSSSVSGGSNFALRNRFGIQVGVVTAKEPPRYIVTKSHSHVQTANVPPVDGSGDKGGYDSSPYSFDLESPVTGTVTGPISKSYPLVYDPDDGSSELGKYRYASGALTSQAIMDSTYPNGSYTLADGNTVALSGNVYPNVPQVLLVNGVKPVWNAQGQLVLDPTATNTITWSTFNITSANFATNGHIDAQVYSNNDNTLNLELQGGATETNSTPFTSLTIPANSMSVNGTYVGRIEFFLASSISSPTAGVYDIAGYASETNFTIVAQISPQYLVSLTPGYLTPYSSSSFNVTGSSLNLSLGFAPAPGTVLTILNNSGAGPIVGNFNNLPDGGTITVVFNGEPYTFTANYEGGDGNDLTLTYTPPLSNSSLAILHSFLDGSVLNDGSVPVAGLTLGSDGSYYGTTETGGSANQGTIFKINAKGVLKILHSFGDGSVSNDGSNPDAALLLGTDGNFYGTTVQGGSAGQGAVFKLTPQGVLSILYSFGSVANDGANPQTSLIQSSDGNFYGTTAQGGSAGFGTAYKITPAGVETVLYSFGSVTNDGKYPEAPLIQAADGNYYGTTYAGGTAGLGTLFQMTPAGTVTIFHNFGDGSVVNDGNNPAAGLIQSTDGNFYGTTSDGGFQNNGTVFKITPLKSETILHLFGDGSVVNDGTDPESALIQGADGNFYSTTEQGGINRSGTIFALTPQGLTTILHSFGDGSVSGDGTYSIGGLIQDSSGNFYGTTSEGGSAGEGTVFKLTDTVPAITSALTAKGTVSLPFEYQTTASNTPTSYAAINLPAGLSINNQTGLITGTPTQAGTTNVTLTLTNASGSETVNLAITIISLPEPIVTSILYAFGSTTTTFDYHVTATNNPTSYSASGLPSGLILNPSTGEITGTPTATGTSVVSIYASNSTGQGDPVNLTINIYGAPPTLSQEYVVLHNFGDSSTSNDGQEPGNIYQGFDGNFYGATALGGLNGLGSIFETNVQGSTTILYSSTTGGQGQDVIQGADGNFYGTNLSGGANGQGFVFQVTPTGTFKILHTFGDGTVQNDGANPNAGLIQASNGNFYGTTNSGGASGQGTVFQITPQGVLSILYSFGSVTNDGLNPENGLIQASGVSSGLLFYGTTQNGGTAGTGTLYTLTISSLGGVSEAILHSFGSVTNDGLPGASNGLPHVIQGTDGNFYGATAAGGSARLGTVYQITSSGQYTILHNFGDGTTSPDGANPVASLIQGLDGNFYGTTQNGGSGSSGTVFQLSVGGTAVSPTGTVALVHEFGVNAGDGNGPIGSLFPGSDGNIYGTTSGGGSAGNGTVFALVASQTPTAGLKPVFTGASSLTVPLQTPFSFTPKVTFGYTGTGALAGLAKGIRVATSTSSATYWTISPTTLLSYLTFDSPSGTIKGSLSKTTPKGIYTITLTAYVDNVASTPQTITFYVDVPPSLNCPATATGSAGSLLTYPITADGNPTRFGLTDYPSWLSVDTRSGLVTGTPPGPGTYTFSVTASNSAGTSAPQLVTLTVATITGAPNIASPLTATGAVGTSLTPYQIMAQNTSATYNPTTYSALHLPTGLIFDAIAHTISGTPTIPGTFSVPITVTNNVSSASAVLTVNVAPLALPTINGNVSLVTPPNQPFSYQVNATGVVSSYAATGLPDGLNIDALTGLIYGTPLVAGTFTPSIAAINLAGSTMAMLQLVVADTTATVTLGHLAATYDGTPKMVTATTNPPGLNVSFTYNGSATPPTAAGSYSVVATINDSYYHGTGNGTLVIAPAPITVLPKAGTSIYGQNLSSLVPGLSVTGLAKGDVVSSLGYMSVITGTGAGITTTTDAGSYKLTLGGALTNTNYVLKSGTKSPAGSSTTWTVTQDLLTVNALNGLSSYGQSPTAPSQLYTIVSSNGVADQPSLLSLLNAAPGTTSYSFNITNVTNAGKYATDKVTSAMLNAGLNPKDYKVALGAAGNWTVTQDIITITGMTNGSSTYGSAPVFNGTSYFTLTDTDGNSPATLANLVTNVKATLAATATSNAGTYSVAVSGALNTSHASSTDYKIVLVPGTWKVNPQPVAITISSGTSVYGAVPALPTLVATGVVKGVNTPLTNALLKGFSTNLLSVVGKTGNAGVGTYAFNLIGAPTGNYTYTGTESAVASTWKITPATIGAITVNKVSSAVYGSPAIDKILTVQGLVNGDLPHTLGYTLIGLAGNLNVGSYTFGLGGTLTNANYVLKSGLVSPPVVATGSKVTITPAPLTFTLQNGSSTFGTAPVPANFNYTVTGLMNGDTVLSTDILLGFTETPPITATTHRGKVAIVPVAPKILNDSNYKVAKLIGGTWTVQ